MRAPRSAVLLAAGRGERLRPYTDALPKPILPASDGNALGLTLDAAARAGIRRVCIVTHYMEHKLREYAGDGSSWGLQLTYVHQALLRGSGDALLSVLEEQPDWVERSEAVLVTATDYLMPEDMLAELVQFYAHEGCEIGISLRKCRPEELASRSSIEWGENGRILRIVEKPQEGEAPSEYAASLVYVLPPEIWDVLPGLEPSERGEVELPSAVNLLLEQGFTACGLVQSPPLEWQPYMLNQRQSIS